MNTALSAYFRANFYGVLDFIKGALLLLYFIQTVPN